MASWLGSLVAMIGPLEKELDNDDRGSPSLYFLFLCPKSDICKI